MGETHAPVDALGVRLRIVECRRERSLIFPNVLFFDYALFFWHASQLSSLPPYIEINMGMIWATAGK